MRFADLISLIWDNLGRRKGRVALTAVGVVIGTAAVVTLVSLGAGLQQSATNQLWGINDLSSIQVYPGYGEAMFSSGNVSAYDSSQERLLTTEAITSIEALPGVTNVIAQDMLRTGSEISFGKLYAYSNFTGVNLSDLSALGVDASQGSTALEKGKVVVGAMVSRNFYNPNQRPNDPPVEPPDLMGQTLKFTLIKWSEDGMETRRSYNLEVAGVLAETKGQEDYSVYVPMEVLTQWNEWAQGRKIDRNKQGYAQLIVKAESPNVVVDLAQQITDMGYQAYTPQSTVQGINSFFTTMQIIFGGVGAIALLVAAIGIANTMTMSILERTREIGIMKAIGATNNHILTIFLGEAAGIGFIGGIGGLILGWALCAVINAYAGSYLATQGSGGMLGSTQIAAVIPLWLPFFSVAFATVIGLLSGLYPALNAATLVPVNALKYE